MVITILPFIFSYCHFPFSKGAGNIFLLHLITHYILKFKATILLFCLGIYFFDVAEALKMCKVVVQKSACCKTGKPKKAIPKKCSSKTEDCTKICVNCPPAYTAIISSPLLITAYPIQLKNSFPFYQQILLGEFYSKAWKPPKNISFS